MFIPGFVDLQVNGYGGIDFSSPDLSEDDFLEAVSLLQGKGTVVFLPTMITSSPGVYQRNLQLMSEAIDRHNLSVHVPGFHLEGPFISKESGARGVHNPLLIRKPDPVFLDHLMEWSQGKVRIITIAAETEGAEELTRYAAKQGIIVSLGHQLALSQDMNRLANAGAIALTHLGNGMPSTVHRHENPLMAGLAQDNLTAMIITDGYHLPLSVIKIILRTKGTDRIIVTSDSSPLAGLPPGTYQSKSMGGTVIKEPAGRLYNPQLKYLAGSSSTLLECINFLASLHLMTGQELIQVGYTNPLNLLGISPETMEGTSVMRYDEKGTRFIPFETKKYN